MSWLASLPHQIPFRAASKLVRRDEKSIDGTFLWTANDRMPAELMLVEAMAQFAGGLVFDAQGFLSGIDSCEIKQPIEPGDVLDIHVTLDADFGGMFRFTATASMGDVEVGKGRFYLSR